MDWRMWMEQRITSTEIQRGGATVWPAGGRGLLGDPLGPVMHLHDGASEIFYFLAGRCRLEIGDSEEFFGPGRNEVVLRSSGIRLRGKAQGSGDGRFLPAAQGNPVVP